MDKIEDSLYQAIIKEDQEHVSQLLTQGASPNKTTRQGKTCLGEAANIGNIGILIMLIDNSLAYAPNKLTNVHSDKKRQPKSHKRKLKHESKVGETVVKCKSLSDRSHKDVEPEGDTQALEYKSKDKNLGYFVFVHSDVSSSDDSRVPGLNSTLSPVSLVSSPQGDLEWDEDIGSAAPTTSEDETWTSLYRWYASILESTGVALATMVSSGIDQQDAFMRTALHYAAEQGHTAAAKLLIDAGCKVDIAAGDGLTPLHVTAMRNYIETAKLLLASGSHVNYKTHEKMTPLHFAASRGYLDLVKILVAKGAYLEARDLNERTPLYLAAGRGHSDVVKYLIASGAHVNSAQIHGYTPLCEAVWQRYPSVVEALMLSGARITHSHHLLHNAIIQRQEEIVRMLAAGGGINLHNDNGDTPLHIAARLSLPKIARILLQKGAHANCANSITGANALHIAVESIDDPEDFEELLKCLLQYNIDMNWTTLTGDTALNRALLLERDTAAILLVRYGSDSNASDLHSCGLDNLAIASRRRSHTLANILLKAGHEYPTPDSLACNPVPGSTAYWLQNACRQPLSLLDICRIKIRSQHGNRALFQYVSTLPLPKCMIRFLMMDDEG